MESLRERPNTLAEKYLCVLGLALAFAGAAECGRRILTDPTPGRPHPFEFVGLALMAGWFLYLLWQLLILFTVRYELAERHLVLRQVPVALQVELTPDVHLHRWRRRWAWNGAPHPDLGVEEIGLFPPVWVGRSEATWVLVFPSRNGRIRAAAFRPSPALLERVRDLIRLSENAVG